MGAVSAFNARTLRIAPAAAGEQRLLRGCPGTLYYLTDRPASLIRRKENASLERRFLRGYHMLPDGKTVRSFHCLSPEEILTLCSGHEAVTFDVFDTLLYRCVNQPGDVFRLLEMRTGIMGLAEARRKAEAAVRAEKGEAACLQDIWERMAAERTVSAAAPAAAMEMETERAVLRADPAMVKLVTLLKENGIRVAVLSDMYLSSDFLTRVLAECGYPAFDRVLVSCEAGCGKADGSLHRLAEQELGVTRILHIGDNLVSDGIGALLAGHDAGYTACRSELDMTGDAHVTGSMAASVWRALCGRCLSEPGHTAAYLAGYSVAGPMALGYCRWLQQQSQIRGWDKILFASRDGWPLYRMYTRWFGPAEYLLVSRAAVQMLDVSSQADAFVDNNLISRIRGHETLRTALTGLGLGHCLSGWEQELPLDQIPTRASMEKLKQVIRRDAEKVERYYASARQAALAYYRGLLEGCSSAVIADTGWKGSATATIRRFLQENGLQIRLESALLGTARGESVQCQTDAGRLLAYLYSPSEHTAILHRQFRKHAQIPCTVTELLFLTDQAQLLSYETAADGHGFTFAEAGKADNVLAAEQQQGMMDYARDFLETERLLGMTFPISPEDAYAPLDALTEDRDMLLTLYGSHVHTAAPTAQGSDDTFAAMLKKARW